MNSKFKKIMAYSLSTALIVTSCFTMGLSKKTSQVKADETANTTSYEAVKSFDFSSGTQGWSATGFKSSNLSQTVTSSDGMLKLNSNFAGLANDLKADSTWGYSGGIGYYLSGGKYGATVATDYSSIVNVTYEVYCKEGEQQPIKFGIGFRPKGTSSAKVYAADTVNTSTVQIGEDNYTKYEVSIDTTPATSDLENRKITDYVFLRVSREDKTFTGDIYFDNILFNKVAEQESTDESTTTGETETTTEEETKKDTDIATITKNNDYIINFAEYNDNFIVGDTVTVKVTLDADSAYSAGIAGTLLNEGDVVGDNNWRSAVTWWVTDSDENKTVTKTATFKALSNSVNVQNWSSSDDVAIKIKDIKVSVEGEDKFVKIPLLGENESNPSYKFKLSDYNSNFTIGDKVKVTATLKSDKYFNGSMCQTIMLDGDTDYKWQGAASLEATFTKGEGYTGGDYEVIATGVFKPKYDSVWLTSWTNSNTNIRITDVKVEIVKEVKIDGTRVDNVVVGETYTLPSGDKAAIYGYYCDGVMYKQGEEVTVNDEIDFTSVKDITVTLANGAGIRTQDSAGMRFQASITADDTTMTVINKQDAITEGMLITAYNLYTGTGDHTLDLKSTYTTLNVENGVKGGWYAGKEGTYCGSIVNIQKENYIRKFMARAYVKIKYSDNTEEVIYSDVSNEPRTVRQVAKAYIADSNSNYGSLAEANKTLVDSFATAEGEEY